MRTHVKKKRYKAHVRDMVLGQQGNTPAGAWVHVDVDGGGANASAKNSYYGTRGK